MRRYNSRKTMLLLCGIFLLQLPCLHGLIKNNVNPEYDMKFGFIAESRRTYFASNEDESYGYIDEWKFEQPCDSVTHQPNEYVNAGDSKQVINVEDADKIRRPHLYKNERMAITLLKNKNASIQIVGIVGAILVSIVGFTGLACLYRHMNDRRLRF